MEDESGVQNGNRKLFWKEADKVKGGKVKIVNFNEINCRDNNAKRCMRDLK